jgi:hypothetical protein
MSPPFQSYQMPPKYPRTASCRPSGENAASVAHRSTAFTGLNMFVPEGERVAGPA